MLNQDDILDRIRGMLFLGVYGDALGAIHEPHGFDGEVGEPTSRLPEIGTFEPRPWYIWAPEELAQGRRGIPTDDSAFRLFILQSWLTTESFKVGYDEAGFRSWMETLDSMSGTEPEPTWLRQQRHGQVLEWLEMFEAAEAQSPDEKKFFSPTKPAVFGLFMILELAAREAGQVSMDTYERFYDGTVLDQGYGRAVTALLAALLSDSMTQGALQNEVCEDLVVKTYELLDTRLGTAQNEQEVTELGLLSEALVEALKLGREYKGQSEQVFMNAFRDRIYEDPRWPFSYPQSPWRRNIDPLLFFMQIIAALAFTRDSMQALRILAWGAGDSDTVASILGSLLGARLGYQQLLGLTSEGVNLADELQAIRNVLESIYRLDLDSRVELFLPPDFEM